GLAPPRVAPLRGRAWPPADGAREFQAFDETPARAGPKNRLPADGKLAFEHQRVVGFRAPYLGAGSGLFPALKAHGFRYDASRISPAAAWPDKVDSLWRFNLVPLRISGSGRGTLSMDYNFFVAQSRAANDPRRRALYSEQMLATYLDYFRANYTGSRAPLHIGHHFFAYQGGVYNEALKAFARTVCGLPEVRCTTYERLADFMDGLSAETL